MTCNVFYIKDVQLVGNEQKFCGSRNVMVFESSETRTENLVMISFM